MTEVIDGILYENDMAIRASKRIKTARVREGTAAISSTVLCRLYRTVFRNPAGWTD
ncbi:MAG: hypothetical protein Q4F00_08830 [bacterium]|nr:hypothetical protein [bacterium]